MEDCVSTNVVISPTPEAFARGMDSATQKPSRNPQHLLADYVNEITKTTVVHDPSKVNPESTQRTYDVPPAIQDTSRKPRANSQMSGVEVAQRSLSPSGCSSTPHGAPVNINVTVLQSNARSRERSPKVIEEVVVQKPKPITLDQSKANRMTRRSMFSKQKSTTNAAKMQTR